MGPARNMLQAAVDSWVKQGYRECRILMINYLLLSLFPNQVSDIRIQNHPEYFRHIIHFCRITVGHCGFI